MISDEWSRSNAPVPFLTKSCNTCNCFFKDDKNWIFGIVNRLIKENPMGEKLNCFYLIQSQQNPLLLSLLFRSDCYREQLMPTNWSETNVLSDGGMRCWFWTTRRHGGSLVRLSHRVPQHSRLPGRDASGREHSEYLVIYVCLFGSKVIW